MLYFQMRLFVLLLLQTVTQHGIVPPDLGASRLLFSLPCDPRVIVQPMADHSE
jgi:hypothetical protein